MKIDKEYIEKFSKELFEIPSPSGFCKEAINFIEKETKKLNLDFSRTNSGNGIITIDNKKDYTVALSGHVDTNGAIIRSIASDGKINFSSIGSPIWATVDAEYCKIITRDNCIYTGTFLSNSPSSHVYKDASSLTRTPENMYVRIDELVKTEQDVKKLGIEVGNFISIEPKLTFTKAGFIKARFLDDKIGVAVLFGFLKLIKEENIKLKHNLKIIISTYEEVGHGASYIPKDIDELIAVDMGCIGKDLTCSEQDVSICCKDSSGPYDYKMTSMLIEKAKKNKLGFAVDVYPFYGSDASAAQSGGNNISTALIGPGVHASHGMERTHFDALDNTIMLLVDYLKS